MDTDGTSNLQATTEVDVYDRANKVLQELIAELCEAMEEKNPEKFKRMGYEMVGIYSKTPINTGVLTLVFASVLQDIMNKLAMTQENENVTVVRDQYSVMRLEVE